MKFSVNIGQYYSNVDIKNLPHDELLQRMGLQLGAIENAIEWGDKYKNIVVVKVIECRKHPNADKLSVCRVDDGGVTLNVDRDEEGLVQVVCGAPNVKGGIHVAWIPPGATVPSTVDTDPFILEARKIRGEVSNGMLASPKELDISDDHEGILILEPEEGEKEIKIGAPITQYFGLDDFIVDCENKMFTHRPDCFGNLGITREVAGIFGLKYQSPEWYTQIPEFVEAGTVTIHSDNPILDVVPRFMVVAMNDVTIKQSPIWMQSYLKRIGIKPINNVVDVTNFVMHLTGQPLHAFDQDKIVKHSKNVDASNVTLQPRMAKKGEKLKLLGDKTIELSEEDIVIATDSQPVALAGIMGGADTEVDEHTRSIVIECANFDMYAVRRSSMRHGLFTDAVTRFNKGQSPLQNDRVLAFAMQKMSEHSGAHQSSNVIDIVGYDKTQDNLNRVEVNATFINERLGTDLKPEQIKQLLENVEFIVSLQGDNLQITVPFWRMDIAIAEDVVEEIGRLYGYEKVPVQLPHAISDPTPKNLKREYKQHLREQLTSRGATEVLTYSFVHGDLIKSSGVDPDKWCYHLRNALSPDLQYYRPSLTPSLLQKIHPNLKAGAGDSDNEFAIFEIGKAHIKDEMETDDPELPKQLRRLAFVYAADDKAAKKYQGSPYYQAKKYLDAISNNQLTYAPLDDFSYPLTAAFKKHRSAVVSIEGNIIGVIGEYNAKISKKLKLPAFVAGFEIDVDLLHDHLRAKAYAKISDYPETKLDVTFEVNNSVTWHELYTLAHAELAVASAEEDLDYAVEPLTIFQPEEKDVRRVSFRIHLSHHHKTLRTEEANKILDHTAEVVSEKLGATRI